MAESYDIAIISRGRIIEPGEGAVEFRGRGGARFRAPDPHRHVHDLMLTEPDAVATMLCEIAELP